MCYSVRTKTSLKEIAQEFRAREDLAEFAQLFRMRLEHPELKIPFGLDRYFLLSQDPAEARLAGPIKEFHARQKEKNSALLASTETELLTLLGQRPTKTNEKKAGVLERKIATLRAKLAHSLEQIGPLDDRVFPFYFAPVILEQGGERKLVPARYRVQNRDGSEVPGQYNVFNARRDSLLTAPTWRPLLGKNHLVFPFQRFYEWVERAEKKEEIYFSPEGRALMWAAGLYSLPINKNSLPIRSFAMITDDPPPEVAAASHDRCPIFLAETQISSWLHPQNIPPAEQILALRSIEKPFYLHGLAG